MTLFSEKHIASHIPYPMFLQEVYRQVLGMAQPQSKTVVFKIDWRKTLDVRKGETIKLFKKTSGNDF